MQDIVQYTKRPVWEEDMSGAEAFLTSLLVMYVCKTALLVKRNEAMFQARFQGRRKHLKLGEYDIWRALLCLGKTAIF